MGVVYLKNFVDYYGFHVGNPGSMVRLPLPKPVQWVLFDRATTIHLAQET